MVHARINRQVLIGRAERLHELTRRGYRGELVLFAVKQQYRERYMTCIVQDKLPFIKE